MTMSTPGERQHQKTRPRGGHDIFKILKSTKYWKIVFFGISEILKTGKTRKKHYKLALASTEAKPLERGMKDDLAARQQTART